MSSSFFIFFATGLVLIFIGNLFSDDFFNKYITNKIIGFWLFGGFLLIYSIYALIKGFIGGNKS